MRHGGGSTRERRSRLVRPERYRGSVLELSQSVPSFAGSPAVLVRVVRFEGFGGRREGEATLRSVDGRSVGSVLSGTADAQLATIDHAAPTRLVVPVGDAEAVNAGLACGGSAELFVQPLSSVPARAWELMDLREPFVLATRLDGPHFGESIVVATDTDPTGVSDGHFGDAVQSALDQLRLGRVRVATVDTSSGEVLLETMSPAPHVLVIGVAELASAIRKQGMLLGWTCEVIDERVGEGVAVSGAAAAKLGPLDAIAVLSHDLAASCTALAAALRGRCGYVGALGSRHTQAARRERLLSIEGVGAVDVDRIHGPIGLDLGARTPEETALAIFAEALAVRRGRNAARLSSGSGPING